jgi:Protein of unknown function (DUF1641)
MVDSDFRFFAEESFMSEQGTGGIGEAGVVAALERVEGRLARIEGALARVTGLAAQAEPLTAVLFDTFDDAAMRLSTNGVDMDARLRAALALADRLTAPATARAIERALAVLSSPAMLALLDAAHGGREAPPRVGLLGLLGALRDPDVQRALGLALAAAARVGGALREPALSRLPARADGEPL